jgi:DNA-binding transcriptional LysR family regulator
MASIDGLNWDHLRVFLATMRAKSLRKAAQELQLTHPTARRRLGMLEEQLGLQLFERRRDGLHPTLEAGELHRAAEDVERAVEALARVAQAVDPALHGPIRVSLPQILATDLLMPSLVAFAQRWPEIELELDDSYDLANLDRREADVAIRLMPHGKRPAEHLTGRLAGIVHSAIYGVGDSWIGWRGPEADREWIAATMFPDLPSHGKLEDPSMQRAACVEGLGLTVLPCFYAEPLLSRRSEPEHRFDIWVLVHPDLRRSPRLRVFRDAMVAAVKRLAPRLEGRCVD